jgi:hypothetical protein
MAVANRFLPALWASAVFWALCATGGAAQGQPTVMSGRCQECSWDWVYCDLNGMYYETCSCRNVFDGSKICRCRANRRMCDAECEEGGGACSGEASGGQRVSARDVTWAWTERGAKARPQCAAAGPEAWREPATPVQW